jgi:hypothetical protein
VEGTTQRKLMTERREAGLHGHHFCAFMPHLFPHLVLHDIRDANMTNDAITYKILMQK